MPVKIRELDPKTGKPKQNMPLPKPKPRHANPKHPMNTEKTKPLGKAAGGSMKIKSGDTLSQIAKKNNISLRDLLSANPSIKNANQIRVGQSVKLPKTKMTGSSIGATRNPYKSMSKKDMSDLDVKNKSAKRQQDVTKRSRVSAMDELKAKAKAPKALPKLGEDNVDSVETKKQKASRTGSIKSATTAENSRLEAIRQKARGRADRRMGGGTMKKKVQGYKSGGVVRGAGAATKGKRFGRCG
jgi:LysM repeat protein